MTRFEQTIQARVPVDIVDKLERLAEERCQTLSAVVRDFVVRGLKKAEARRMKK